MLWAKIISTKAKSRRMSERAETDEGGSRRQIKKQIWCWAISSVLDFSFLPDWFRSGGGYFIRFGGFFCYWLERKEPKVKDKWYCLVHILFFFCLREPPSSVSAHPFTRPDVAFVLQIFAHSIFYFFKAFANLLRRFHQLNIDVVNKPRPLTCSAKAGTWFIHHDDIAVMRFVKQ